MSLGSRNSSSTPTRDTTNVSTGTRPNTTRETRRLGRDDTDELNSSLEENKEDEDDPPPLVFRSIDDDEDEDDDDDDYEEDDDGKFCIDFQELVYFSLVSTN